VHLVTTDVASTIACGMLGHDWRLKVRMVGESVDWQRQCRRCGLWERRTDE
jgi:hypothetical protein